jgi:beta-galactosidase
MPHFSFGEWEDPRCFGINKEAAHATLFGAETRTVALAGREASSRYLSLNGRWQFRWAPRFADQQIDFVHEAYDANAWGTITVPGNWELHEHGFPIYTNVDYIFEHAPPKIAYKGSDPGHDYNPTGAYRKSFRMPWNAADGSIYLHIGAVTSAVYGAHAHFLLASYPQRHICGTTRANV